ncbi:MAG TPA: hypothetical protein VKB40_06610 [Candidatus Acidoferrales bacterium]|nr:hypothetical protein [Candidatus Acidoferrales bacterium]
MNARLGSEKPAAAIVLIAFALAATLALAAWTWHRSNRVNAAVRDQTSDEVPSFYCNLKALGTKERARHMLLTLEIERSRAETIELGNGFAFRFQDGSVSLADLAEWVSAERKCCPFFDFEIELQADNGRLWLKLRGKDGVKAFMRSEFGIH